MSPPAELERATRVERAQEHEISVVLALVEELLAELGQEGREFAGIDRRRLQTDLRENLRNHRFLALLAKDAGDTPIGVLTLSVSFALHAGGEYGVIDEIYVLPAQRNRGVGRKLVAEATAVAKERGWFRLDVTGPGNSADRRVLHFYEQLGFGFTGSKLRLLL